MADKKSSPSYEKSICLQISELLKLTGTFSGSTTIFEPGSSSCITMRESSNIDSNSNSNSISPPIRAPEKKLTLFALRLAVLEKAATGLGTLGFIWATVVLLGGFAITLEKSDFWFITIILLIEGTRIFSRSHELEWQQHQSAATKWSMETSNYVENSDRLRNVQTRRWKTSDVPLLPYAHWVFISSNISKLLYWLQLFSATSCVILSLMKLIKRNYGDIAKGDTDKRNRQSALNIFYSLALSEALMFLMEKAYWEWKVIFRRLLEQVNEECELGISGMVSIKRFFYDAYSRCVNGSIFDGLKMDMVSFAMELLGSSFPEEQLIGVRILRRFSTNSRFSDDTLQKIGVNLAVVERLVEMLNWKDSEEEEIRISSAEILSKLAGKKQNSIRLAGIPGAMESISSLLHTNRNSDEITEKKTVFNNANSSFWTFNHLGLVILKKLAHDHDNCGKIGNTRGLLQKIISFTQIEETHLRNDHLTPTQIETVKKSLQLMKMLAKTTGTTGKHLRREISEMVFSISNLRDVIRYGDKHPMIQKLGIEILTSLALDEEARERIGGTGGVLKGLFKVMFKNEMSEICNRGRIGAGEAVAMLALGSERNCERIVRLEVLEKLVKSLEVPLIRVNGARILRNLCVYSGEDGFLKRKGVANAASMVLEAIKSEDQKLQEAMIGLAPQIFNFTSSHEATLAFQKAAITEPELAATLVQILRKHRNPPIKTPQIRRFVIETAIWMMKEKKTNVDFFNEFGMERELEAVLETTSELESFNIFSGTVGLSRHGTTMESLVETALTLLI